MAFWTDVTFFARSEDPVRSGPDGRGLLALRWLGWMIAAGWVLLAVAMVVGAVRFQSVIERLPEGGVGTDFGSTITLIMLVTAVDTLAITMVLLWSLGWCAARWQRGEPKGVNYAIFWAVLIAAYSLVSLLQRIEFLGRAAAEHGGPVIDLENLWLVVLPAVFIVTALAVLAFGVHSKVVGRIG